MYYIYLLLHHLSFTIIIFIKHYLYFCKIRSDINLSLYRSVAISFCRGIVRLPFREEGLNSESRVKVQRGRSKFREEGLSSERRVKVPRGGSKFREVGLSSERRVTVQRVGSKFGQEGLSSERRVKIHRGGSGLRSERRV